MTTEIIMKAIPVLYLDLDGTVRHGKDELGHFVNEPSDVVIFPEALEKMRQAKADGWRIIGVTNQGGVSLGYMTYEVALDTIAATHTLTETLFDRIMMCVHHPYAKDPEMAICWCRKPRMGLVLEGALSLSQQYPDEYYPPHMALFVGDRSEDMGCAEASNMTFMWAKDWRSGTIAPLPW